MPTIRVLIVDDAVVMRRMITEALSRDPAIEVVGTASNGSLALQRLTQYNPDAITMDVDMPELNGLQTLRSIRTTHPKLPVIMVSSTTAKGALTTLDALAAGATDYITKPTGVANPTEGIERLAADLIPRIKIHCRHIAPITARPVTTPAPRPPTLPPTPPRSIPFQSAQGILIGTSTGGPNALHLLFSKLPERLGTPIFIVQHMPPVFTKMLAERLSKEGPTRVIEAEQGVLASPGNAYIAPGGHHMTLHREGDATRILLNDDPPENSCRPAVDVLFRSAAPIFGAHTLAIIMTGMGSDGLRGCQHIHEHHGIIIAQNEATSVVWGMPGYVVNAGLARKVLTPEEIAGEIRTHALPFPA